MIDSSIMLPNSICSTPSILIAFSRYPSTASCMVTAVGSDFTALFLRMLVDGAPGGSALSSLSASGLSSICILESSSWIALLSLSCLLPLTVVDADFMINLLFGFRSGSIGLALDPDAAGADDSASVISAADLSLLLHFCSSLLTSSASTSR